MRALLKTRTALLLLGAGVLLAMGLAAQQERQPPKEQTAARRIPIPVVVTDDSGKLVSGLKPEDFEAKQGPNKCKLTSAEEVQPITIMAPGQAPLFVVLDKTTIVAPLLGQAHSSLLTFLANSLNSGQPIGLLAMGKDGIEAVHQPATDGSVLAAALLKLDQDNKQFKNQVLAELAKKAEKAPEAEVAAELVRLRKLGVREVPFSRDIDAAFVQLRGLQQLANGLRRMPGRKQVLFVTRGLPLVLMHVDGRLFYRHLDEEQAAASAAKTLRVAPGQSEYTTENLQLTLEFENAVELLNASKVAVYPLMINRLNENIDPMANTLARATAAKYVKFELDLDGAVKDATSDFGPSYLLACELPAARNNDVEWAKLDLKVKKGGAKARAPEGAFLAR